MIGEFHITDEERDVIQEILNNGYVWANKHYVPDYDYKLLRKMIEKEWLWYAAKPENTFGLPSDVWRSVVDTWTFYALSGRGKAIARQLHMKKEQSS